MAPLWRIQWTAALVSSPPEKAMPTLSPTGTWSRILPMSGADGFECVGYQADRFLDLALADDQRRDHADGPRPGVVEHDPLLQTLPDHVGRDLILQVEGDHQAHASDRAHAGPAVLEVQQLVLQRLAGAGGVAGEIVVLEVTHGCQARGAAHRVAAHR